jgi:hypothetical protein
LYQDMTKALSVAATTHLISPEPDQGIAATARHELDGLRRSQEAAARAEHVRQAAIEAELADRDRRLAREVVRAREAQSAGR